MTSQPFTIDLGDEQSAIDRRIESGEYASPGEVIQAALRALDREEAARDDHMRQKIQEALEDPSPDIPLEEAFREFWAYVAAGGKPDAA